MFVFDQVFYKAGDSAVDGFDITYFDKNLDLAHAKIEIDKIPSIQEEVVSEIAKASHELDKFDKELAETRNFDADKVEDDALTFRMTVEERKKENAEFKAKKMESIKGKIKNYKTEIVKNILVRKLKELGFSHNRPDGLPPAGSLRDFEHEYEYMFRLMHNSREIKKERLAKEYRGKITSGFEF